MLAFISFSDCVRVFTASAPLRIFSVSNVPTLASAPAIFSMIPASILTGIIFHVDSFFASIVSIALSVARMLTEAGSNTAPFICLDVLVFTPNPEVSPLIDILVRLSESSSIWSPRLSTLSDNLSVETLSSPTSLEKAPRVEFIEYISCSKLFPGAEGGVVEPITGIILWNLCYVIFISIFAV